MEGNSLVHLFFYEGVLPCRRAHRARDLDGNVHSLDGYTCEGTLSKIDGPQIKQSHQVAAAPYHCDTTAIQLRYGAIPLRCHCDMGDMITIMTAIWLRYGCDMVRYRCDTTAKPLRYRDTIWLDIGVQQ